MLENFFEPVGVQTIVSHHFMIPDGMYGACTNYLRKEKLLETPKPQGSEDCPSHPCHLLHLKQYWCLQQSMETRYSRWPIIR